MYSNSNDLNYIEIQNGCLVNVLLVIFMYTQRTYTIQIRENTMFFFILIPFMSLFLSLSQFFFLFVHSKCTLSVAF